MTGPSERTLRTDRLVLRPWCDEDLIPWAALNADPETMRYFPAPLTRSQSDRFVESMRRSLAHDGFCIWAVELVDDPRRPGAAGFVGAVGLLRPRFEAHFTPCVEVGWRLARAHWGCGYATEAARAALDLGFGDLGLDEIVSFTAAVNAPSRAVMVRLGMHRDPADDFLHPRIPPDHRLQPHVLYRLARHGH